MTKADRALIATYAADRGGERFRLTRSGEVHIFGVMPNSNVTGWWLAGYTDDLLAMLRRETRAA